MNRIVVDASVILSWCFPDEQTASSMSVLDPLQSGVQAIVPALWAVEVLNSLLVGERKGRIAPDQTAEFYDALKLLEPALDYATLEQVEDPVQTIYRDHRLTPYDALDIELAQRSDCPLRLWIRRSEMQQPPLAFSIYERAAAPSNRGAGALPNERPFQLSQDPDHLPHMARPAGAAVPTGRYWRIVGPYADST